MARPSYKTCDEVTAECPLAATTYGYYPVLGANAFFAAYFGLAFLSCLAIGVRTKTWTYTLALGIGTFLECIGYIGRILMHNNPWNQSAFEMQICALVLAPSFVVASVYLSLKHVVLYCGPQYSRLKARLYPWVFVGSDFGSIVLQAIGGGVAASASGNASEALLDAGNGLIVAGITFQVATMVVCGLMTLDFFINLRKSKTHQAELIQEKSQRELESVDMKKRRNFWVFCGGLGLAFVTILIRCIYRIPEMAGGWGNPLMRKEKEFLLLDGMMIAFAVFPLVVVHPGIFFTPMRFSAKRR